VTDWAPPPRPAWVRAVNAGEVEPIREIAELPLDAAGLLAEAHAQLGLAVGDVSEDVVDDGYREALEILVRALEDEAELTLLGRWLTRRFLLRLLEVRLQVLAYVAADPGVRDEVVRAPVIVTGAPRTGTTILYDLMAEDPTLRTPYGWELLRPVPPPLPGGEDGRVDLAERELRAMAVATTSLDSIHVYSARAPKECLSSMSFAFRSEEFTTRYRIPTYRDWLAASDPAPAYAWHRLVLQVLQRRTPTSQWVLKSPVHAHALPAVQAEYPDARVVVTHRDPLAVLGSLTSLVATLRWAHSDAVDYGELARENADRWSATLDRLVTERDDPALTLRVVHSHYASFVDDPLATVGEIFRELDLPLTTEVAGRMAGFLVKRPRGGHSYSFEQLGLDRTEARARFTRYQAAFAVPNELS
jgi:Sulfotransferase family